MGKLASLGDVERAVLEQLWSCGQPQTVRQIHYALSACRLAYITIVLQRLADKNLVVQQHRDHRALRYVPAHGHAELIAGLIVDALNQAADPDTRQGALVRFVERFGADDAAALRRALAALEAKDSHGLPATDPHPSREVHTVPALAVTDVAA